MEINAIFESANSAWNNAFNTKDIDKLVNFYAENATLSPGNGETLTGHGEIQALFKLFIENGLHNHGLEIIAVGGSDRVIYQVAKWHASGTEEAAFAGITTSVMEQGADAQWRTISHVWNMKV